MTVDETPTLPPNADSAAERLQRTGPGCDP